MYLIINTQNNSKFKEPSRKSWRGYTYKTKAAATAAAAGLAIFTFLLI